MAPLTLANGLVGGFVATAVMTAFMTVLGDGDPPPTALFWSMYVGDGEPEEYERRGMALHVLYGVGAGGVFVVGLASFGLALTSPTVAAVFGLAYGLVLFGVGAIVWMDGVLDLDAEPETVAIFLLFHLIYGVVLAGWLHAGSL